MKYQKDTIHNGNRMLKIPRYKYNEDADGSDVTVMHRRPERMASQGKFMDGKTQYFLDIVLSNFSINCQFLANHKWVFLGEGNTNKVVQLSYERVKVQNQTTRKKGNKKGRVALPDVLNIQQSRALMDAGIDKKCICVKEQRAQKLTPYTCIWYLMRRPYKICWENRKIN